MRNFERESILSPCAIILNEQVLKAFMVNFSRMGAAITTTFQLSQKKYISLMYRNEKNEMIRMLAYVVHCQKKDSHFTSGLQFVGIEQRTIAN